ncbi:hypothetical protein [[Mycobacterium] burgundiense]|uniref:Cupin n=1 Tax=[Mycobacterium] burgundiense TaxID=3064286 RepID=A0ABM9LK78_9MYCO|nr:hypothetical protein [Mycolicibacterium sp. MU0053]CAJ1500414.1 hypothetical protein MU0053_001665 [Mycolicibacterium sp. MU0053]
MANLEPDLEVWIARLPEYELRPSSSRHGDDDLADAAADDSPVPNIAVFDHWRPDSFVQLDEFPAVLCRDMAAVTAATNGQVEARVLKANPAHPWPQPPWRRRTTGARLCLLIAGTVWFDLAGIGEESFSAKDSWCLPGGLDHALLEASTEFELLEIELPVPPGPPSPASDVPEMLMLNATYNYRSVPLFGKPNEHPDYPRVEMADPRSALALRLDDKECSDWAGCPWHLHDQGIQCGYLTSGTAHLDIEGLGLVDAQPGTFWLQQANARHLVRSAASR